MIAVAPHPAGGPLAMNGLPMWIVSFGGSAGSRTGYILAGCLTLCHPNEQIDELAHVNAEIEYLGESE